MLLVQLFLAVGWLRAAVAHGISSGWWNGTELAVFRDTQGTNAVGWYRQLVLDGLVGQVPFLVALVVLLSQVTVAAMLGLRHKTLFGLALGAFLNLNFVLAGAVDPSAFYLVLSAAVAMWHFESSMSTARCWWLTFISTIVGFTLIGSLAPTIATLRPAAVIEDPALVLTFITLLWITGLWVTFGRRVLQTTDRSGRSVEDGSGGDHSTNVMRALSRADTDEDRDLIGAGVPAVSNTILVLFGHRIPSVEARAADHHNVRPEPQYQETEPVFLTAESFEDAKLAADEFKRNVPVLLNVREVDGKLAGRLINVAIGICYSLGGTMEKMGPKVFLLIPEAVEVSQDERRRMEEHILVG